MFGSLFFFGQSDECRASRQGLNSVHVAISRTVKRVPGCKSGRCASNVSGTCILMGVEYTRLAACQHQSREPVFFFLALTLAHFVSIKVICRINASDHATHTCKMKSEARTDECERSLRSGRHTSYKSLSLSNRLCCAWLLAVQSRRVSTLRPDFQSVFVLQAKRVLTQNTKGKSDTNPRRLSRLRAIEDCKSL